MKSLSQLTILVNSRKMIFAKYLIIWNPMSISSFKKSLIQQPLAQYE